MWYKRLIQRFSSAVTPEARIKISVEPTNLDPLLAAEFDRMVEKIKYNEAEIERLQKYITAYVATIEHWKQKYETLTAAIDLAQKIQFKESIKECDTSGEAK